MLTRRIAYCNKCRKGHILVDNAWIRCKCVIEAELKRYALSLGIPDSTTLFDISDLPSTVPSMAELKKLILSEIDPPRLNGRILFLLDECREELAYSILLWFVRFSFQAKVIQLEECTDLFIAKQREEYKAIRESPVLVLFFGREMTSRVHQSLINFILEFRLHQGFFTIAVFDRQVSDLAKIYGKDLYTFITNPNKVQMIPASSIKKFVEKRRVKETSNGPQVK